MNPDRVISDINGGTCRQLEELSLYLIDTKVCEDTTGVKPLCCTNPYPTS